MGRKSLTLKKLFGIWCFLFALAIYGWVFIHELSHSLVCLLLGNKPTLVQILPHAMINCEGIVVNNQLTVTNLQYFLFAIIPYILIALILLFLLKYKKKYSDFFYVLVVVLTLDTLYNFFISVSAPSDFARIARVDINLFFLSTGIVLLIIYLAWNILKKHWKEFKQRFISRIKNVWSKAPN